MRDSLSRRATRADLNALGVLQAPGRESLDFLGNRCREKQGLPLLGTLFHNAPDIWEEAHVEHAVHLVEDEKLERA